MIVEKQENTAPYFDPRNLPNPMGIPFIGFEKAKIPGRESVAKLIDEFIKKTKNGKSIEVCLIRAEWGEGKTDAYSRYITKKLQNQFCFLVSTSTLSNRIRRIKNSTAQSNTAVTFLASLLAALGDDLEAKKDNFYKNLKISEISDPNKYLDLTFKKLFSKNKKHCYIFLDEFEEILYNEDVKIDIISGLKEVMNQNYGPLSEKGSYQGRFHMFVACTPYAWNAITEDPQISHTMGSTKQRLASSLITLPTLTRSDCYRLLTDLTKFTYQSNLKQLPIISAGIFETIINISQKNPRALIQLYYQLMSNIDRINKSSVKCIDHYKLLKTLENTKIDVYGSEISAIEYENLKSIENVLTTSSKALTEFLFLFIGEHQPFSVDEIATRLNKSKKDIANQINQINQLLLNNLNFDAGVESYLLLKQDKIFDSILEDFGIVGEGKDQRIIFDSVEFNIDSLKNCVTFWKLSIYPKLLIPIILIPTNNTEFARLMNLDPYLTLKFHNKLKNFFEEKFEKRHFRISSTLLENLFPSPNLLKFDFIANRLKRLEIRRKVIREMGEIKNREKIHEILTKAIIDSFRFSSFGYKDKGKYLKIETNLGTKKIEIPILIESSIENIAQERINQLVNLIKTTPALLALFFYQTISDDSIKNQIDSIEEIQKIPIERITIEQLLSWNTAKQMRIKINPITEKHRITEIVEKLKIKQYLNDYWIPKAQKSGIIITDLQGMTDSGKDRNKSVISTFISTSNHTLDEQWDFYQKLDRIKFYNEKSNFAAEDIESKEQWITWAVKLAKNSFISNPIQNDNKPSEEPIIKILETPTEERILKLIKENKNDVNEIKDEFILASESGDPLNDYYLSTLIQKGKIKEKSGKLELQVSIDTELENKINSIQTFVENFGKNEQKNRYLCQTKKEGFKVILESDYIELLNSLLKKIKELRNEDDSSELKTKITGRNARNPSQEIDTAEILRLSKLLISIYNYYTEKFRDKATTGDYTTKNLFDETKRKLTEFEIKIKKIVNNYNHFCLEKSQYISEEFLLNEIRQKFSLIESEYEKEYKFTYIEKELEKIWKKSHKDHKNSPFYFDKSLSAANYFSLKFYQLNELIENFNDDLIKNENSVVRTLGYISDIDQALLAIKSIVVTFNSNPEQKCFQAMLDMIQDVKPAAFDSNKSITHLNQIEKSFSNVSDKIGSFKDDMTNIIKNLKILSEKENNLSNLLRNVSVNIEKIDDFLDGSEKYDEKEIENFRGKLSLIESECKELSIINQNEIKR